MDQSIKEKNKTNVIQCINGNQFKSSGKQVDLDSVFGFDENGLIWNSFWLFLNQNMQQIKTFGHPSHIPGLYMLVKIKHILAEKIKIMRWPESSKIKIITEMQKETGSNPLIWWCKGLRGVACGCWWRHSWLRGWDGLTCSERRRVLRKNPNRQPTTTASTERMRRPFCLQTFFTLTHTSSKATAIVSFLSQSLLSNPYMQMMPSFKLQVGWFKSKRSTGTFKACCHPVWNIQFSVVFLSTSELRIPASVMLCPSVLS